MDRLSDVTPGGSAQIVEILADPAVAHRLASLGFRPGTEVQCVRRAPLGDPFVYRLRNYDVCLRRREASYISVRADRDLP